MLVRQLFRLLVIVCLASAVLTALQGTKASKTADNTSDLAASMKFIQEALNAVGQVKYIVHGHDTTSGSDWTNSFSNEARLVAADPTACRITYHYKVVRDGNVLMDANAGFLLKDVRDVDVLTRQKYFDEANLLNGHPSWTAKVEPVVFVVRVRRPANVENQFVFLDEATANHVAKALTHAVEICSNKK